jgi:hypothetical protein
MISEQADVMIKAKMADSNGSLQKNQKEILKLANNRNMLIEYIQTIKGMEVIDKPNCMLFIARLEAYLIENIVQTQQFGASFERLVEEYPSFIDAYVHYWKYLKFRLIQLQGATNKPAYGNNKIMSAK